MAKAVFFNTYKLKKDSSVPDFVQSVEDLVNNYVSKQKGFVSVMLMNDGDLWADYGVFETMEDAINFENPTEPHESALKFYSFLNFSSCKSRIYSVEKSLERLPIEPGVVTMVTFKLRQGVSVEDFRLATEKLFREHSANNDEVVSKMQLVKDDLWADLICWKSMNGPKNAGKAEADKSNDPINEYLAFVGMVPFHRHFSVVKSYGLVE